MRHLTENAAIAKPSVVETGNPPFRLNVEEMPLNKVNSLPGNFM